VNDREPTDDGSTNGNEATPGPIDRLRMAYTNFSQHRAFPLVSGTAGFGFLATLPFLIDIQVMGLSIQGFLTLQTLLLTITFAYLAQSWNLMSGFTGYFSFGHVAFFGIGAYTTQILLIDYAINPWIGMLVGGGLAVTFGILVAALSFGYELEGHYFALATIAFAELLRYIVINTDELNGPNGYYKPFPAEYADGYGLVAFQFQSDLPYFYIILGFLAVVTTVGYLIKHSWIGLYFFAIREDERAAASLGVPVFRYKVLGVTVSALFTGFGGAFWSMYFNTIRPDTVFSIFLNVDIILPAIIGGLGTLVGPIIGAFAVLPITEFLRSNFDQISGLDRIIFGILLIVVPILTPGGMISWPDRFDDFRTWLGNKTKPGGGHTHDSPEVER
jgi:branched-chain amino acid transport system permease protein